MRSSAGVFSIIDAIQQAVQTHPGVGEATANRRATEAELRQQQGTLLPQVRIDASIGPQRLRRYDLPPPVPTSNGRWTQGREASVSVRQLLYDGFASINEIYRHAARTDAAAHRVLERTELIALDAAEAYIDVTRYLQLVSFAERYVETHRGILGNVRARFDGGRAGEGDMQQAEERHAAAQAALAEFRQALDEARGSYRKSVGLEPYNLRFPGRLNGLPRTKDEALAVVLRHNPTIMAAGADVRAAKHSFDATAGAYTPTVSLEGRALYGVNTDNMSGHRDEMSGKVVLSWDVFTGGQTTWRRAEMADRMIEETEKHARLQRDAFEAVDKAWAARTITSDRTAALTRQVESARRVVSAYRKEYELGQRTLIDLLNAENQIFNAMVSLVSTRGVAVFADYQLLATMGKLLEYLKAPLPGEAEPLDSGVLGLFPKKLPPLYLRAPGPGPEPLSTFVPMPKTGETYPMPRGPKVVVNDIKELWPGAPAVRQASEPSMAAPEIVAQAAPSPFSASGEGYWAGRTAMGYVAQPEGELAAGPFSASDRYWQAGSGEVEPAIGSNN